MLFLMDIIIRYGSNKAFIVQIESIIHVHLR